MSSPSGQISPGSVVVNGRNLRKTPCRLDYAAVSRISLTCTICLESYIKKRPTAGACGHVFCSECLTQVGWMRQSCPQCRTPINVYELFEIGIF